MESTMEKFFLIQSHQSGLERWERHPGGVRQVKFDVIIYYVWYILYSYFFMANTMKIFFPRFRVTRAAYNAENSILVEYSKQN